MGFFDSLFAKLVKLWPTFVSGYFKRFMEYVYDSVFQTEIGRKLVAMGTSKKRIVEFGLNLLSSFFDDWLSENTAIKKLLKEVGIDAAPEISKRIFNGIREEILVSAKTTEGKEMAQVLLGLEDKELIPLLNWLYKTPISERMTILGYLSLMSFEQIARLMNFSIEDRERFFDIIGPRIRSEEGRGTLGMMADDINKFNEKLEGKETSQ